MKAATEALIQKHYEFDRDNRFRVPALDQQGQMALQAEAMRFQTAIAAPMIQDQQNQEMQAEGARMIAEQAVKEDDFAREQEAKNMDFEREKESRRMEQEHEKRGKAEDHRRNKEIEGMRLKSRSQMAGKKK
jgi:glycerol kinase